MRACFLGQNITVLGNGIARIQPRLVVDQPPPKGQKPKRDPEQKGTKVNPQPAASKPN